MRNGRVASKTHPRCFVKDAAQNLFEIPYTFQKPGQPTLIKRLVIISFSFVLHERQQILSIQAYSAEHVVFYCSQPHRVSNVLLVPLVERHFIEKLIVLFLQKLSDFFSAKYVALNHLVFAIT